MLKKAIRLGLVMTRRILDRLDYQVERLHRSKWEISQRKYVKWSKEELDPAYVQTIIGLGKKFANFIGTPVGYCLDVGCGNGLFAGRPYDEVGYSYISKSDGDLVLGVDPLPLIAKKPSMIDVFFQTSVETHIGIGCCCSWLDETIDAYNAMYFSERKLQKRFDTIVLATSFDHLQNPGTSLRAIKELLKQSGKLNIWVSCLEASVKFDPYHTIHYSTDEFLNLIEKNGFKIDKLSVEPFSPTANTVFVKCSKSDVQIHAAVISGEDY